MTRTRRTENRHPFVAAYSVIDARAKAPHRPGWHGPV